VLVHGNGDVREFWDLAGVRSAFAEHCTVYAISRRGRGASGDAAAYELEREVEDVAAVVDSIDGPVTLLGHSGGALYSLEGALHIENLHKLILNQPPIAVGNNKLDVEESVTEMKQLLDDGGKEQALVLFLRGVGQLTPGELDAVRSTPIWQEMVAAAQALPRELRAIAEYEFDAARFEGLTTPTLLLSGGESPPLYRDATEAVGAALPNSRIVTFDEHAHEPMNTAPDRFVDEVLTFICASN
jgi:pimeloyl-ACP methyl ester carboxylesterase